MTDSYEGKVVLLNLKHFLIILINLLHHKQHHLLQLLDILKWWHQFPVRKKTDMTVNILQYEDERSNLQPYYFLLHIPNQTKLMTFTKKP